MVCYMNETLGHATPLFVFVAVVVVFRGLYGKWLKRKT